MSYSTASNRLQITTLDGQNLASQIHEDDGGGTPICNIPLRPYKGQATMFTSKGPGTVTCGNCERTKP